MTVGSVDDYRHYIYANGGSTTRYLLQDHQGSTSKITDATGATVVSESFTPFGERRNPATWSGQPVNGELNASAAVTQMGYTGQDALGSLGFNHMNGRVQDPVTGRFLSADPYVTEPGNTQNFNRYSYVYNNPMTFTDPSGFCDQGPSEVDCMPPYWNAPEPPTQTQPSAPPEPSFGWGDFELANPSATGTPGQTSLQSAPRFYGPVDRSIVGGNTIGVLSGGVAYIVSDELVGDYACAKTGQCQTRPVVRPDCNVFPAYKHSSCEAAYPSAAIENTILAGVSAFSLIRAAVAASAPEAVIGRLAQAHANSGRQALAAYMSDLEAAAVQSGSRAAPAIMGQAVHTATARSLAQIYPGKYLYYPRAPFDFVYVPTGQAFELTTIGQGRQSRSSWRESDFLRVA